ncbi:MAG: D-2-hydroxyacid dehydrogenase [Puia sp.]|nr:D-2-hydroxyacid dehydrogenase [Puia sp.]
MQIIITDGYTLNPGDLSWETFEELGKLVIYERTPENEVAARCAGATVIITNKTPITRATIQAATGLRLIAVTATGYNIVDTVAAREKGIAVCNVPEYGTDSVAQHAFALLLETANKVGMNARSVREGDWVKSVDWCYSVAPLIELRDKILGIVGFGRIGQRTAELARAFGMRILFYGGRSRPEWAEAVSLQAVFEQADWISLHCPLRPDNQGFVDRALLSRMKKTAYLINTSRGQLINEADLAEALNHGILAGAALDVLSKEPPLESNPLLNALNCIITPHNAWSSFEARKRLMQTTFENVSAGLAGKPQNVVN